MIVVIPVCSKDADLAIQTLEHAIRLEAGIKYSIPCLVSVEKGFDSSKIQDVASQLFDKVSLFVYDEYPRGADTRWPHPQNYAWRCAAEHIEQKVKDSWFWWEMDAIPLEKRWLEVIEQVHKDGGRRLTGAVAWQEKTGHYIAGVAVYPPNPSATIPHAIMATCSSDAWDIACSRRDRALEFTHDISSLICHTPTTNNTHFAEVADIKRVIPETAVLFHKCKDGSLIDILAGRKPCEENAGERSWRSLYDQCEENRWSCGQFSFPYATNTVFFNPSIVRYKGRLLLITRRYRWDIPTDKSNSSDLVIFDIRGSSMTLKLPPIVVSLPKRDPREQFEDPKAFIYKGKIRIMVASWVHWTKWNIRQTMLELSDDLRTATIVAEPTIGGQVSDFKSNTRHEKNWCPFEHNGWLNLVYQISPHTVFDHEQKKIVGSKTPQWNYGEPRGGTPPIKVGNEWISFFHSALTWIKPKRRYFMGAYAFNENFEITRFTKEPLLAGSEEDVRSLGGPLVVFPNGATFEKEVFTVVSGVNDEACMWCDIKLKDLNKRMVEV